MNPPIFPLSKSAPIAWLRIYALIVMTTAAVDAHESAAYQIQHEALTAGGQNSVSTHYSQATSIGGISGGISSSQAGLAAKHGFVGQLHDYSSLQVTIPLSTPPEGSTSQASAIATCDDGAITHLLGNDLRWAPLTGPIESITNLGQISWGAVYTPTPASLRGTFRGLSSYVNVEIQNVDNDNFGLYSNDEIDDGWQVLFFGPDNPDAAPEADPSGNGQNNLFKYTAGLDPTNPTSRFLIIGTTDGASGKFRLAIQPCFEDRNYEIVASDDLKIWASIGVEEIESEGDRRVFLADTAVNARFYRVIITRK